MLHLVVGIFLRHYILGAALSSSAAAQRWAVTAVRVAAAILADAVSVGGEGGREVVRLVLPPLLKPMLVDVLAKVRNLSLARGTDLYCCLALFISLNFSTLDPSPRPFWPEIYSDGTGRNPADP